MKYLEVLVLEDSIIDRKIISTLLSKIGIKQVLFAQSYRTAVQLFDENRFDILIVDIFLGKNKRRGDEFVRYIRRLKFDTPVIYLTSSYEEKIYEQVLGTSPKCFLSKDISTLSLRQAIELSTQSSGTSTPSLVKVNSNNFFVKVGKAYKGFLLEEILYFYSKDKGTYIQLNDRRFHTNMSLKQLEEMLFHNGFARVHRCYLVNLQQINTVELKENVISMNDELIPIGYTYRKQVLERINIMK